ncbi:LOW QUALITY PROTEIN: hypothetical protein MXB_4738 [Myxobolus squamalis]|nr:LOW QUALITY PROTEIN: hypothetical protein MXB_4738 [Myxobolus squamalis]
MFIVSQDLTEYFNVRLEGSYSSKCESLIRDGNFDFNINKAHQRAANGLYIFTTDNNKFALRENLTVIFVIHYFIKNDHFEIKKLTFHLLEKLENVQEVKELFNIPLEINTTIPLYSGYKCQIPMKIGPLNMINGTSNKDCLDKYIFNQMKKYNLKPVSSLHPLMIDYGCSFDKQGIYRTIYIKNGIFNCYKLEPFFTKYLLYIFIAILPVCLILVLITPMSKIRR